MGMGYDEDYSTVEMVEISEEEFYERLEDQRLYAGVRYDEAKLAKVGEKIECPYCARTLIKKTYHHKFCKKTKCKDKYHNMQEGRFERTKRFSSEEYYSEDL